ncbi:MAG: biosynthetic arginine decarboxylase [Thermoanaerobaculia bacterium]|nr:biosynthetic arginine decarboxylase [Thermoanaerobaculia bacterium]
MTTGIEEQGAEAWSVEAAEQLYLVDRWGGGYFSVDERGDVRITPLQESQGISMMDVLTAARAEQLHTPLLVRFQDILRHRVETLNEAFNRAIRDNGFGGRYRGVFPIKVNQLREVVEEILDAGDPYCFGLEAGSKPELYAALAIHSNPDSLIICNGYKDDGFVRLALLGRKLDKRVILVAEKLSEIRKFIRTAQEMNVEPMIGVRVRLQSKGAGIWATSGGESAKFGLSTTEILMAVEMLREAGMSDALKLIHFHIGSQIPDIITIKRAVREAARVYAKMHQLGHELEYIDVGGGLAIDYDGSRSTFHSSMNYSVEEYASDIVYNIGDICDEEGVPHPDIVSESGRALVAHHSVLVIQAFGSIEKTPRMATSEIEADHKVVRDLKTIEEELTKRNLNESWHDLLSLKDDAQKMFELGMIDLEVRAASETLFWTIARKIEQLSETVNPDDEIPEYLADLRSELRGQHLCNFSVFQSLLDHWALGQLFPIMPLHRLDERPSLESTIVDITCDSDGKISKFIDITDVRHSLPLHEVTDEEPYYLGVFLTGAYQDIMGDIHNLYGRVNEAHIFLDDEEENGFYIEETIPGNTVGEVLELTQYDLRGLARMMKSRFDASIKAGRLKPSEAMKLLAEYERGLQDQTYLTLD